MSSFVKNNAASMREYKKLCSKQSYMLGISPHKLFSQ